MSKEIWLVYDNQERNHLQIPTFYVNQPLAEKYGPPFKVVPAEELEEIKSKLVHVAASSMEEMLKLGQKHQATLALLSEAVEALGHVCVRKLDCKPCEVIKKIQSSGVLGG